MGNGRVALHFSPHPDDELIGAPATLMALRDAGWRIVNVPCTLGRPGQRRRRELELREACERAGFELDLPTERELGAMTAAAVERHAPQIVIGPDPGDRHPGHRLVAEAVRDALTGSKAAAPAFWTWAIWSPLSEPTLATRFDADRLDQILAALAAHRGELERNDYRRLVRGRAEMSAVLAPELLFGFGAGAEAEIGPSYVELLTEWRWEAPAWVLAEPRWLDGDRPL